MAKWECGIQRPQSLLSVKSVLTYGFATSITVFGKHTIKTTKAIRPAFAHNITLTAKLSIAFETCEMGHVPSPTFGFGTFI